jgi:hypothetical protein
VSEWAGALSWGRDEAELVSELQAGSETAFDWLVTHYHAPVYNLILSMLGDTSDAADGSQEVFLKAFRGIRKFRQPFAKRSITSGGSSAICKRMFRSTPSRKKATLRLKLKISAQRRLNNWRRAKFRSPCKTLCRKFRTFFAPRLSCATWRD